MLSVVLLNVINVSVVMLSVIMLSVMVPAALHSYINSLKPALFHLTGQQNSKKGRSAKVKDGIFS
jgi:hypothetical protein